MSKIIQNIVCSTVLKQTIREMRVNKRRPQLNPNLQNTEKK